MATIPTTSPDMEAWLIGLLNNVMSPVRAYNVKPERSGAYALLVVRADLQNKATPISRYCRVGIQAWSVDNVGRADLHGANRLAAAAGRALETAPLQGVLLNAEVTSGPMRVEDDITRLEFSYLTALLEVAV